MDRCLPAFLDEYPYAPDGVDPPAFLDYDPTVDAFPYPMEPAAMPHTREFDEDFASDVTADLQASIAAEVDMNDMALAAQEDLAAVIDWLGMAAGGHPSVQNFIRQVERRLSGKPLSPALRNVVGVWQPAGTPAVSGGLAGTGQFTTGIEDFIPGITDRQDIGFEGQGVIDTIEDLAGVGLRVGQALQQLGIIDPPQEAVPLGAGQFRLPSGQIVTARSRAPSGGSGSMGWIIPVGLLGIGMFFLLKQ